MRIARKNIAIIMSLLMIFGLALGNSKMIVKADNEITLSVSATVPEGDTNYNVSLDAMDENDMRVEHGAAAVSFSHANSVGSNSTVPTEGVTYYKLMLQNAGRTVKSVSINDIALTEEQISEICGSGYRLSAPQTRISVSVEIIAGAPDGPSGPGLEGPGPEGPGGAENVPVRLSIEPSGIVASMKVDSKNVSIASDSTFPKLGEGVATRKFAFQAEFGSAIERILINGTEYTFIKGEEDWYTVNENVPVNVVDGVETYNINVGQGEWDGATIIWSTDPRDKDSEDESFNSSTFVENGSVELVSISRAGKELYSAKNGNDFSDKENEIGVSVPKRGDEGRGYVTLKKGDDVVVKLIPNYGYQLKSITINDQTMVPQEEISTFELKDIQGNLHFSGVFEKSDDEISNSSDAAKNVKISEANNAVNSGNVVLSVASATETTAVEEYCKKELEGNGKTNIVSSFDISLDNKISKGNGEYWVTSINEFEKDVEISFDIASTVSAENSEYVVVREHNGKLELIDAKFDATNGKLTFKSNRFSTYSLVEKQNLVEQALSDIDTDKIPEEKGFVSSVNSERQYWYENGVRQGVKLNEDGTIDLGYRGKEIFDSKTNSWYWLDNVQYGAVAKSKDVYQESLAGIWGDKVDEDGNKIGKWVRYDENGHMIKGWDTNENGTYYFDMVFGTMAKGNAVINGVDYKFDETTGCLVYSSVGMENKFVTGGEKDYWYEGGVRQGYVTTITAYGEIVVDLSYRGKEIYDPMTDAWYWLDNVQGGAVAKNKDVYQESAAGAFADNLMLGANDLIDLNNSTGKWVRYDENGRMIKGWCIGTASDCVRINDLMDLFGDNGQIVDKYKGKPIYYFDITYGSMAKGNVLVGDNSITFDAATGELVVSALTPEFVKKAVSNMKLYEEKNAFAQKSEDARGIVVIQ